MEICSKCGCKIEDDSDVATTVTSAIGSRMILCDDCASSFIEFLLKNGFAEEVEVELNDGTKISFEPDEEGQ